MTGVRRDHLKRSLKDIYDIVDLVLDKGVDIRAFGLLPHEEVPNFDNTALWQSAVDSGEILLVPPGTFIAEGFATRDALQVIGTGWDCILKLADNTNDHVMWFENMHNITIQNLKVDGNKANQTAGLRLRGIYFTAGCSHVHIDRVWNHSSEDHGIFFSSCGEFSLIENSRSDNCGSAQATAGGTGFVGGTKSTTYFHCWGHDNYLNGFKAAFGQWIDCLAENNGGGFETGFGSEDSTYAEFFGCRVLGSLGTGFRHQGSASEIQMISCIAEDCEESGVVFLNNTVKGLIHGGIFRNNGQNGVRSATVGLDGISFLDTSGTPNAIRIESVNCYDDQAVPTQEYGIYISDDSRGISIGGGTNVTGNKIQGIRMGQTNIDGCRISREVQGISTDAFNVTPVAATGATTSLNLMQQTIKANELHRGSIIRVRGGGTVSGTAGTKVIRFNWGNTSGVISSQSAGETQDWHFQAEIVVLQSGQMRVMMQVGEIGGQTSVVVFNATDTIASDFVAKVSCTLGNAADTVTQTYFAITTER